MPLIPEPLKTYDPREISLIIAGLIITGYADGTFINVEFPASFTKQIGAQGSHTRSRVADASATLTVTLQQTSPSNAVLAGLLTADRQLGTPFPVLIRNNLGLDVLAAPQAYITQRPAMEFGAESGNVEWTIELHNVAGGVLGQV